MKKKVFAIISAIAAAGAVITALFATRRKRK